MKIPRVVRIAGHDVRVSIREYCNRKEKAQVGSAKYLGNKIVLSRKWCEDRVCKEEMAATFLHEVIHHIGYKYDVDLKERQVNRLSNGLYQVLKENKFRF